MRGKKKKRKKCGNDGRNEICVDLLSTTISTNNNGEIISEYDF